MCQQRFPHFTQSRFVAGESIYGDTLYCDKQSVAAAIASGVYGSVDMKAFQSQLESIFPNGVCQYPSGVNSNVTRLLKNLDKSKDQR